MATEPLSSPRRVSRLRVLRPLLWWLLFVAVVTPVAYHRRNYPFTRIAAEATIDGLATDQFEIRVGSKVVERSAIPPLGPRRITVSAVDCEPFTTNRFVWYGVNSLGSVELPRKRQPVRLSANPPALRLTGTGPYQQFVLTNVTETNLVLAVGTYQVLLDYGRFSERRQFTVVPGTTEPVLLKVATTTVALASDKSGVVFQLRSGTGAFEVGGTMPTNVALVPVGNYSLEARRGDYVQQSEVKLTEEGTNALHVRFPYGAVLLTSMPSGAQVRNRAGTSLGVTPLTLEEVRPGEAEFLFDAPGHVRQSATVKVRDGMTDSALVRLHSTRFAEALESARRRLSQPQPDLEEAYAAAQTAVNEEPDSAEALALRKDIALRLLPARAAAAAEKRDFAAAIESLGQAIELAPENNEFKASRSRYVELARVQGKAALTARFEAMLKEAAAQLEARQLAAALKTADDAAALEPGDTRAPQLRAAIQQAMAQAAAQQEAQRKQAAEAAKRRFPEETFVAETARQKDAELFEDQNWRFKGSLANFIAAAERAFKGDSIKWEVFDRRTVREDTWVAWAKFSSFATAPRMVALVANEQDPGDIVVRAKFWVYSYGDGMRVDSGTTPVNPKFYYANEPARSRQKCMEVIHGFKTALEKELK